MKPFFTEADCDLSGRDAIYVKAISIDKANLLLEERGVKVTGLIEKEYGSHTFGNGQFKSAGDTHQALLINIQPLEKKDAAEALLKEMVNVLEFMMADEKRRHPHFISFFKIDLIERAKRLLEGEK